MSASLSASPDHDPIAIALAEDIGSGDLSATYFIPEDSTSKARIFCKEKAVLAGVETARKVFQRVDDSLNVQLILKDGSALKEGETVLEVEGKTQSIITAERVALNFLQHLSGIATLTSQYVEAIRKSSAEILDTRKTTPGLRALEKAAVVAGGGTNHRFGLYDMVMVKDNHLLASDKLDSLQAAIDKLQKEQPGIRVELEADTLQQVRDFLTLSGVDVILLDNMKNGQLREAVAIADGKVKLEASGGISLETAPAIAATGVDYLSVGAVTHSVRAIDFSLEIL